MNRIRIAIIVVCIASLGAAIGCTRDPNVRKRKYFESGERYEKDAKYREAIIQYSNALRLDKNYAEAHYGLARAYMKTGALITAYGELLHTVEVQPGNVPALIDLA